jgi:ankyrin repeat protein
VKYAAARESLTRPVDDASNSLLHLLCATGRQRCLEAILKWRSLDNAALLRHNSLGESPLHAAILAGKSISVQMLLSHIAGAKATAVPSPYPDKSHWLAAVILDKIGREGVTADSSTRPRAISAEPSGCKQSEETVTHEHCGDNCMHLAAAIGAADTLDRLFQVDRDLFCTLDRLLSVCGIPPIQSLQ